MGEWKAQISLRVRQDLRRELEEFAYKDRRKLGNVGEALLEWAWGGTNLYCEPVPPQCCKRQD
jgi:hypothetical protein